MATNEQELREKRDFVSTYLEPLLKEADKSIVSVIYRSAELDKIEGVVYEQNDHHFVEEIQITRASSYQYKDRITIIPVSFDSKAMMIKDAMDNGDFF